MSDLTLIDHPPAEVQKFIDLLVDPNLTTREVDEIMGYAPGTTALKISQYQWIKDIVKDGRMVALRRAGVNKAECFKVYRDALEAVDPMGHPAHEVRIKAADRLLTLMGEKPTGGNGGAVGVTNGKETLIIQWGDQPTAPTEVKDGCN